MPLICQLATKRLCPYKYIATPLTYFKPHPSLAYTKKFKQKKMATSDSSTCLQYHEFRSISLPSRLNPQNTKLEVQLNKLKTWRNSLVSSTIPTSGETIRTGLVGLAGLYNCVEELIQSPITQQALVQQQNGVLVEEALEGSIGLLDSCNVARDLLLMMKENLLDVQSVLRRKGGGLCVETNISAYNSSKKKVKKESTKCLRALKRMESKIESSSLVDTNYYLSNVIRVLREVAIITISILRFFFLFLSVSDSSTRYNGWSSIKNLVVLRPAECKTLNEIETVDVALQSVHGCIRNNNSSIDLQMTRWKLETLEDVVEGLESGFNCLFRQLIRNRVSLLNILAQ